MTKKMTELKEADNIARQTIAASGRGPHAILARQFLRLLEPKTFTSINLIGDAIAQERARWKIMSIPHRVGKLGWLTTRAPKLDAVLDHVPVTDKPVDIYRREFDDESTAKLYVRCACIIAGLEAIGIKCEPLP